MFDRSLFDTSLSPMILECILRGFVPLGREVGGRRMDGAVWNAVALMLLASSTVANLMI